VNTVEFLSHIRTLDVALSLEGERLRYSAARGVLTPALRQELVARKEEIIAFLRMAESATSVPTPHIEPISHNREKSLSFAQQRLWFLQQLEPDSVAYNVPIALRLHGRLNMPALEQAISEIVRRHETLRTTFSPTDSGAEQVVSQSADFQFSVADLRGVDEKDALMRSLMRQETGRVFDLVEGPMLRARVLQLAEEEQIVLLTIHHIAVDGWSMGLLVREVVALYGAFATGRPSPLPELKIQYADYAAWQSDWLRGEVLEKQLAYWRQQLSGAPPVLDLPTDHPRTGEQASRGEEYISELPIELAEALSKLSQREGVTLFMTLLAAFQALLYKYTGQEEIVVGTPIAGRNFPEIENLVGFFVNTLALRTDLSGDPTFIELLQRVRETSLQAYAHQDVPFEMLVEDLQPERSLNRTPLFQVMFALQNAPHGTLQLPGLQITIMDVEDSSTKFDLSLDLLESEQGFQCRLRYNADLFEARTIRRMAGHFQRLLTAAAAAPEQRISASEILMPEERHQLLRQWNDTFRGYQLEKPIHQLIEAQVERTPAAVAAVFHDEQLTYQELNEQANRLAWKLIERGIKRGSYVPVLLARSTPLVVAWLAVMKTGAAFVPLDTDWPLQRLRQVLDELGSEVVLVNRLTPQRADELDCTFITVEDQVLSGRATNPEVEVNAREPIYAMYTSGSTGKPKGVVVTHRGITNRFLWMDEFFGHETARAVLQTTRQVYDSAVWQLFWPMLSGGKTVIPSPEMGLTAEYLTQLIKKHSVTMTDFVPSVLNVIVPQLIESDRWKEGLQTLRCVIVGGEEITAATAYQFMQHFPTTKVVNLYGPTEATIGCICYELTGDEAASDRQRIPIGKPIANACALILDDHRKLVPAGVKGELYLSGVCLGLGYLNDEEKTKAAFVDNPYPEIGWNTLYKTGDVARYLPDGNIEFWGRRDHQVKIRGLRIELGEIEAILRQHPQVSECLVVAREDPRGEKRLLAYLVQREETEYAASELRQYLKERLPDYMVPSVFMKIGAMPLTAGGKLDHRRLPEPEWVSDAETGTNQVGARTAMEEIIAGTWAELLGLELVNVNDDFFAVGGHSLLATQVVSRLRSVLQVEVPLRYLFKYSTVAELAKSLEELLREKQGLEALPPLRPVSRSQDLPLSYAQRRLWFLDQLTPGSPAYNLPGAVRLDGPLNIIALEQSFSELIRRHESLRTSFARSKGQPVQIIHPPVRMRLPLYDLSAVSESLRPSRLRRLIDQHAHLCFDLRRGPLLRVAVVKLTPEEHILLFTIHHIVSDAWSIGVLISEVIALYEAFSDGKPSPLAELPVQYADFAVWQHQLMLGEMHNRELAYWRQQLEGVPPLDLPTDRPRPAILTYRGSQEQLALSAELTQALKALSQRKGVTLFMTLLAGWQALLNRYTDQEDMSIGLAVANRNYMETESLIGFFVNMLVLRTDLSGNPSFLELLERVREVCLQAYAHQDLPFEKLVEHLKPERDLSRTPLFQVVFQMLNNPKPKMQVSGLHLTPLEIESGMPHFDLILSMADSEQGLTGILEYNSDLFDAVRIKRMLEHYQALLAKIVDHPERNLLEILLTTQAQADDVAPPAGLQLEYADDRFMFETN
jgi:amino acid adenylation domain-containing protein